MHRIYHLPSCLLASFFVLLAIVCLLFPKDSVADEDRIDKLLELSMDKLMAVELSTASTYTQKLKDVPSSASIVTSDDIKSHGYRTLADALASLPSVYVTYDRSYRYIGVRGFSRPGDFNTRILLLVDGVRVNDNIYNQGYVGTESLVDIDWVEKIEFIPGPAASIYGDNAFLGVINVMTKDAKSIAGGKATLDIASYQSYKTGIQYGTQLSNGADMVLAATSLNSQGQDWRYKEFIGEAHDLDGDAYGKILAKLSFERLDFSLGYANREKQNPTAPYDTLFDDSRYKTRDQQFFFSSTYNTQISSQLGIRLHLDVSGFDYRGYYPGATALNMDDTSGRRQIADVRFTSTQFKQHKLVFGYEYIHDSKLYMRNVDADSVNEYLKTNTQRSKYGLYVQDEFRLNQQWIVNAGLRFDHYQDFGGTFNPRVALIYQPSNTHNLKFIYGRAFRAPNAYETDYETSSLAGTQKGNTSLQPEFINTLEFVWDYALAERWSSHASLFYYDAHRVISQKIDPSDHLLVFENADGIVTKGIELGVSGELLNDTVLDANLTFQDASDQDKHEWLVNSPRILAKFGLSKAWYAGWNIAADVQYTGKRLTKSGDASSFILANASVYRNNLLPKLDFSLGIYNLFDKNYGDPADVFNIQDTIKQDGRIFKMKFDYRF